MSNRLEARMDRLHALERAIGANKAWAARLEAADPTDQYVALTIHEDTELLEALYEELLPKHWLCKMGWHAWDYVTRFEITWRHCRRKNCKAGENMTAYESDSTPF